MLFHTWPLFQQYVCVGWAVVDQNKLNWLCHHQVNIRADVYDRLKDSLLDGDADTERLGWRIILPSSYTGGDCYIQQRFQNAMAITRHLDKPSLFITFTANPQWPEIQRELLPNQNTDGRPDLTYRVFRMKHKELFDDLKQKNVFGNH